ncbi:MAG: beta-lactamase family protein [Cytophagales bacterium]|nr:beta-lactamase family protein [Cytophagales bacterium]
MNKNSDSYPQPIRVTAALRLINWLTGYCAIAGILISCSPKEPPAHRNLSKSSPVISDTYKPHAFAKDDRIKRIKNLAPQIKQMVEAHIQATHIPGVAYGIVVDDQLVVASGNGLLDLENKRPVTTRSAFRIASMTKSFTAMAVLKLRDEGKLSLSDPVADYIPEMDSLTYPTADAPTIDIENLLTMTAGLPEDNPWGDRQLNEPEEMLNGLIAEGLSFSNPPSYQYEYSNTGYALLGRIISRVAGMPYQQYIREQLLQPLGMDHTYWEYDSVAKDQLAIGYRWEEDQWKLEPMLHDGSFGAMGGLITSIEDFSKYVSLHLSAWPPRSDDDQGPVKRSTLREMHSPQFTRLYAEAKDMEGEPCPIMSGYGYGLGISEDCQGIKRVSHGGALPGFGSNYSFFPDYGIGIMAFGNLTYTSPWPTREVINLLFDSANLQPRQLPPSDILLKRQEQVTLFIQHWDEDLEAQILAENFYLDQSREHRRQEIQQVLNNAGAIQSEGDIQPLNQLRGSYKLLAENGDIDIFFTLTPEQDPKVQYLRVRFQPNESK